VNEPLLASKAGIVTACLSTMSGKMMGAAYLLNTKPFSNIMKIRKVI
jgi:hypothetical protein